MLSPKQSRAVCPSIKTPNPALAPTILHPFSMTFLIHPFPPPSLHSQPQEESSPSSVFLRPSAPMMTSNSNSDRGWSAGRNSARQPISARTEKWDELAVSNGRTKWLHAPCVGHEKWTMPPGTGTPGRGSKGKTQTVQIHTWTWSPSGLASVQSRKR